MTLMRMKENKEYSFAKFSFTFLRVNSLSWNLGSGLFEISRGGVEDTRLEAKDTKKIRG